MAGNVYTRQILVDGQKNVVIKVTGLLDTSDLAVTGTIGASGFTTTLGLNTIAFVAGALLPTLGQYVTFGDSAATFVVGTYITGITDATHITVSTHALKNNAAAAVIITGTTGNVVLLDPTVLSAVIDDGSVNGFKATKLRVDKIVYDIEDLLSVDLYWAATADVQIWHLVGRGKLEFDRKYGGLQNNAGAGVDGKIEMTTQGWVSSALLSFSFTLECTKQW